MAGSNVWPIIHAERAALAADLAGLPDPVWGSASLCRGWSVQQVLGHMTATAAMTPARFLGHLAAAGFRFQAMTARDVAAYASGSPRDTLAEFSAHLQARTAPPGPVDSWLGETVVHGTDIRWPLGISHEFAPEALIRVAEFYQRSNALIGAKRRIAGLRLLATDTDWSTGSGPETSGPLLALVMAMTGRSAALDQLTGPGIATLRTRTGG